MFLVLNPGEFYLLPNPQAVLMSNPKNFELDEEIYIWIDTIKDLSQITKLYKSVRKEPCFKLWDDRGSGETRLIISHFDEI